MADTEKLQTLDVFIANEQDSIKWSLILAFGLFLIGLAASTYVYWLSSSSAEATATDTKLSLEAMVKYISAIPVLAGAFISGFPIKDYFTKKNRITFCKFLRVAYESPPVPEEIDKRFWTLVDKNLG